MPSDSNVAYLSLEIEGGASVLFTLEQDGRYIAWLDCPGKRPCIGRESVTQEEVNLLVRDFPGSTSVEV